MTSQHTKQRLRVVSGAIETESGIPIARMDREPGNDMMLSPLGRYDTAERMVLAYNSRDALVDGIKAVIPLIILANEAETFKNCAAPLIGERTLAMLERITSEPQQKG